MTISHRTRNLVIAVALAAAAVMLTVIYVGSARGETEAGRESVNVFVAVRDFPAGTSGATILKGLRSEQVQQRLVVPAAIRTKFEIARLYSAQPIYKGEQVTLKRFTTPKAQGIRAELTGTERAIRIAGDANQVLAGTLRPGDRVDVVANFKPSVVPKERTAVILRDVRVLETSDKDENSQIKGEDTNHAVLLALTDRQAQQLVFALENGDWWLQLRPVKRPADSPHTVETHTSVLGGRA
jgi:Flp pilus assembly protein CpaB